MNIAQSMFMLTMSKFVVTTVCLNLSASYILYVMGN